MPIATALSFVLGMLLVVLAWSLELWCDGTPCSVGAVVQLHLAHPSLVVMDLLPFVAAGHAGAFVGLVEARSLERAAEAVSAKSTADVKHYRRVLDKMGTGIIVLDSSGRIREATRRAESLLHFELSKNRGMLLSDLVYESAAIIHTDTPCAMTLRPRRATSTTKQLDATAAPLTIGDGHCVVLTVAQVAQKPGSMPANISQHAPQPVDSQEDIVDALDTSVRNLFRQTSTRSSLTACIDSLHQLRRTVRSLYTKGEPIPCESLTLTPFDPVALARSVAAELSPVLSDHERHLDIDVIDYSHASTAIQAVGDLDRVRQILVDLVLSALRTGNSGSIPLRVVSHDDTVRFEFPDLPRRFVCVSLLDRAEMERMLGTMEVTPTSVCLSLSGNARAIHSWTGSGPGTVVFALRSPLERRQIDTVVKSIGMRTVTSNGNATLLDQIRAVRPVVVVMEGIRERGDTMLEQIFTMPNPPSVVLVGGEHGRAADIIKRPIPLHHTREVLQRFAVPRNDSLVSIRDHRIPSPWLQLVRDEGWQAEQVTDALQQTPDVWLLISSVGHPPAAPLCPGPTIVIVEPNPTGNDATSAHPIHADATVMVGRMNRDARRKVGASITHVVGAIRELENLMPTPAAPARPSSEAPHHT